MTDEVRLRLKALRNRTGLRSRDVAESLDMPASTYQKYEDRRQGVFLPLSMVAKLVLALKPQGIEPVEVWALADPAEVSAFHQAWAILKDGAEAQTTAAEPVADAVEEAANWNNRDSGHRRHERWNPMPARMGLNGSRDPCVVKDISPGGARVLTEFADGLEQDSNVNFELIQFGEMSAKVVHLEGNEIGLRFSQEQEDKVADWLTPMRAAQN